MTSLDRLFGRDDEVDRLVAAIDGARSCVIVGEPGIGKTALLESAVAAARGKVRRGRAFEMLMSEPYFALREATGSQLAGEPPEVTRTLSARLRGTVLVIDDAHWCDPDTLAVLNELVAAVPVIVTVRSGIESVAPLVARMAGIGEVIPLEPLAGDVIRAVLEMRHPGAPSSDLDRWTRAANGNPLAAQLAARNTSMTDVGAIVVTTFEQLDLEVRDAAARLALHGLPLALPDATGRALLESDLAVTAPADTYQLRHPLIAAAVVSALDDEQRARLHRELASTATDPSRQARHLAEAGDVDAAAIARHAATRAPTIASRAALLLLATVHDAGDDECALEAADALLASARYADVIGLLASRSFADPDHATRADLLLAHAYWVETRIDDAQAAIDRLRFVKAEPPSPRLVEILTLECRIRCRVAGESDLALEVGREAVRIAQDIGHGELAARSALGLALLMVNDDGWIAELERAQELVRADDDLHEAVVAADMLLFANLLSGDPHRCHPIAERMIELSEGVSPAWNGYFRAASMVASVVVDGNAAAALDAGPALLDRPLTVRSREMSTWSVALAFADAGRDADALVLARRAVERASDPAARSMALWALAETHWLAGRLSEALATAMECAALPVSGFPGQVSAAVIGAWAAFELGLDIDSVLTDATASPHRNLRGAPLEVQALSAIDPAVSTRDFAEATTAWSATSRRAVARCELGVGQSAMRAGDRDAARRALAAASALCAEHGLVALDGRVRAASRAAGAGGPISEALPPMSERVLRLVAAGATTAEIATSLRVQPSTVESHIRSALRASGSSTRAQAASASGPRPRIGCGLVPHRGRDRSRARALPNAAAPVDRRGPRGAVEPRGDRARGDRQRFCRRRRRGRARVGCGRARPPGRTARSRAAARGLTCRCARADRRRPLVRRGWRTRRRARGRRPRDPRRPRRWGLR